MRIHLFNQSEIHKLPPNGPENTMNNRRPNDMRAIPVFIFIFIFYYRSFPKIFNISLIFQPFSSTTLRHFILKWIITTNKPFDEVEHSEFWDVMKIANPKIKSFSRFTIRRDLDFMHLYAQKSVKDSLQVKKNNQSLFLG